MHLLFSKVATLMVSHVPLGPEALAAALRALERPLVDVDSHMNSKILLLTEGFSTAWELALVGLSSIM